MTGRYSAWTWAEMKRCVSSQDMKFSFSDLEELPDQTTSWDGVRNYQVAGVVGVGAAIMGAESATRIGEEPHAGSDAGWRSGLLLPQLLSGSGNRGHRRGGLLIALRVPYNNA